MSAIHLHFDMDVTMGPMESDGHRSLSIHSLRIQLPEELETAMSGVGTKERPIEKRKQERKEKKEEKKEEEEEEEEEEEVVPASPLYSWSDEHALSVKQDRLGELLWPVILRSYNLVDTNSCIFRTFATYKAFQKSDISRHPDRYAHHSIRDLMVLYIEGLLPALKGKSITVTEAENLKRRMLLRQRFANRRLVWSPEYMEIYSTWSSGCQKGMNRYQKIEQFVQELCM